MLEDNKKLNNVGELGLSMFKDNQSLAFICKKTEKIASAIYLVSNLLSDKEPIKWDLRNTSLDLINEGYSIVSDRNNLTNKIGKLISLLEVSFMSGLISQMNKDILVFELTSLFKNLTSSGQTTDPKSLMFPADLFEVNLPQSKSELQAVQTTPSLIRSKVSDRVSVRKILPRQNDKVDRREVILSMLRKDKELGIKDFVSSISDCSEKTIQRELASLVSKGLVKKEGEKRWSRYSLR